MKHPRNPNRLLASTVIVQDRIIAYSAGFVLSLALTIVAFAVIKAGVFSNPALEYTVTGLALTQALVQLLFFLHLGQEREPRWKLLVFDLMLFIICVLVLGSLWIMDNLDYNMSGNDASQSIIKDEGIKR